MITENQIHNFEMSVLTFKFIIMRLKVIVSAFKVLVKIQIHTVSQRFCQYLIIMILSENYDSECQNEF